ncbi:MAG TPA: translation initiation factor IF-2 N-terminal domain-containing protein, partial [Thermoanaerobaculia bacterium]|nr:translation initiation factor IF-2 N-terminal domain-containing protein [Thermoanaerobaculia bacterium]
MAAAKIKVSDIAKKMGKSEKDVIFQLQSLGAEITDASQVLEPEVIQALITGKKLVTRTRSVIMREDKPIETKKKEAVRPPRPIVQPPARKKAETPKEEPAVAAPPSVIIPEFVEAAEAEERAAKEAPATPEKPARTRKVAAEAPAAPAAAAAADTPAAASPQPEAPPLAATPAATPAPPAQHHPAPHTPSHDRRPTGPTGPRARAPQGPRPNYAGQQTVPTGRPTGSPPARPNAPMGARPAGGPSGAPRPSGPGGPRPGGPMGARPGAPMGARPAGGPGARPGVPGRGPMSPSPLMPGSNIVRRKKEGDEESHDKKKTAGKRGTKTVRGAEFDQDLLTKGPFSGTQIINDDIGPDIVMPDPDDEPKRVSSRRDARKQTSSNAKVLEFKRPTGRVALTEGVTVKELAERLDVKASDLMKHLFMKKGLMASINNPLGADLALEVARELGIDAEIVSFEEAIEMEAMEHTEAKGTVPRGPVITVMGHVDHGKTSLLDAIRETRVAEGEAGGITQHIGAYHVEKKGRKIVFLDTPGHEAFTMMRARGAKVTDIVVLVVAADDGVMPQTKEAIDHARAAKVALIVAINKIDKPNANIERVRRELADANVLVEQWGGDVVSVEVSAKQRTGIDALLDMILLTSDLLELKANPDMPAKGVVLEARKEVGRGIVATVLIQDGTLRI